MDLRPSLPLRSPLATLNSNQQRQRDQDNISTLFSPGGGRTTRAASRKLRKLFQVDEDVKISSSASFETSSECGGGGGDSDSRTDAVENAIDVAMKPKNKAGLEYSVASKKKQKKKQSKTKSKSKKKKGTTIGRWETWERMEFLRGLRRHGRGHWKTIGENIPTRSTIQVKTHAQVMLRKLDQGTDIFEELDRYENSVGKQEANNHGRDGNLGTSSLPLPVSINDRKAAACYPKKSRQRGEPSSNGPRRDSFPLSKASVPVPPPFQPVTTTTVTTTMVGNHNHHHPFHHQVHHHYGAHHHNHNQHHHPYQFGPSFDAIAAAVATSSPIFPSTQPSFQHHQNSAFQPPMAPAARQGSSFPSEFFARPEMARSNDEDDISSTNLYDAEVDAITALLRIRKDSENDPSLVEL